MRPSLRFPFAAHLAIALIVLATLLVRPAFVHAQAAAPQHTMVMSTEAMKQRYDQYWATHKPSGTPSTAAAVTVIHGGDVYFDADGNTTTTIEDTVYIHLGDTVQWTWDSGFHTVTNGTDQDDPNLGSLFNVPLDSSHRNFSYQFNAPGDVPYLCVVHGAPMVGLIHVYESAGVPPTSVAKLGFTRDPSPNPSNHGVSFAFTLASAGRVHADVFDANGRRIARIIDTDFAAGAHVGAWDGRRSDGRSAGAGVYYIRLRLPGYDASRRITITK